MNTNQFITESPINKQKKDENEILMRNNEIIIRTANNSDLELLQLFFIKAYGNETIFKDRKFLEYYFQQNSTSNNCHNIIAENNLNDIVSHYGGLETNLRIKDQIQSLIWGVSAFTIPEFRGIGLNSKIVEYVLKTNTINGVIGFTKTTALFYQKLGFNIFDFKRFSRHVMIIDIDKSLEVSKYINRNGLSFNSLNRLSFDNSNSIIELTTENINSFDFKLHEGKADVITVNRSKEFIKWRFFNNPYVKYSVFGYLESNEIKSYIAIREEELTPFKYKATRIIDFFGDETGILLMLRQIINSSISKNHIYLDFSMFGNIYKKMLKDLGFSELEDEACCILPQITSPIGDRDNYEYIGLFSKTPSLGIDKLTIENVYFTRMDSDRDRLVNISQATKKL